MVCRFLPARVGRLLVAYLAEAQPFRELLESMDPTAWVSGTMLWEISPGQLWDTTKISQILKTETGKHLGISLNINSLRHIMIAFGRQFNDTLKDFAPEHDDDDDDKDGGDDVFDLQASLPQHPHGQFGLRGSRGEPRVAKPRDDGQVLFDQRELASIPRARVSGGRQVAQYNRAKILS